MPTRLGLPTYLTNPFSGSLALKGKNCLACQRPAWDGGHALSEGECSSKDSVECRLFAELTAVKKKSEHRKKLLAEHYEDTDNAYHRRMCPACHVDAYYGEPLEHSEGCEIVEALKD